MYQHINADYYGFRDEEDGVLEKVEAEAERNVRRKVSNTNRLVFFSSVCKVVCLGLRGKRYNARKWAGRGCIMLCMLCVKLCCGSSSEAMMLMHLCSLFLVR